MWNALMSMNRLQRRLGIAILLLAGMLGLQWRTAHALDAPPDLPAGSNQYRVDHFTIDGGGGLSLGSGYSIHGTLGQPDADPMQPSVGASYAVTGGFWALPMATLMDDVLFRNGFD